MTTLSRMKGDLLRAVGAGHALAGLTLAAACSSGSMKNGEHEAEVSSGGSSAGIGADGGGGVGGMDLGVSLPKTPYDRAMLSCYGEEYPLDSSGYIGQCCYQAHCYEPKGSSCLPADDPWLYQKLPRFPQGSGDCQCDDDETHPSIVGPYAANPTVTPESAGDCCYLIGVIECTGRPLRIDGLLVLGGLNRRNDWRLRHA